MTALSNSTELAQALDAVLGVLKRATDANGYRNANASWEENGALITLSLSIGEQSVDDENDDAIELRDRELHHFETEQMLDNTHTMIAKALNQIVDGESWTSKEVHDLLVEIHDAIKPKGGA